MSDIFTTLLNLTLMITSVLGAFFIFYTGQMVYSLYNMGEIRTNWLIFVLGIDSFAVYFIFYFLSQFFFPPLLDQLMMLSYLIGISLVFLALFRKTSKIRMR